MTPHAYEAERKQATEYADLARRQREYERKRLELRNSQADADWRLLNISPKPIDTTLSPFTSQRDNIVSD